MLHSQGDKTPEMTLLKNQYKGVNSLREVHTGSLTGKIQMKMIKKIDM